MAKLREINNWGAISYRLGKKEILLEDIRAVRLRRPNGAVGSYAVELRPHTERVSDMGHEYDVRTKRLYVLFDVGLEESIGVPFADVQRCCVGLDLKERT